MSLVGDLHTMLPCSRTLNTFHSPESSLYGDRGSSAKSCHVMGCDCAISVFCMTSCLLSQSTAREVQG
jgi:hypothetical protein